ncbi:hypothetical protein K466DRAFT_599303 [Polyporus arcularius HHB13444]|uniref:Uncharacterized protein n=1 Tax=Polyporus arcularius HHB13444 TaxID=1314778 RepID=A0A5C3PDK1_9APHY|nr:hypothetical protein K466DRAFT_599303 [Polyporus arcularius HHB13444]
MPLTTPPHVFSDGVAPEIARAVLKDEVFALFYGSEMHGDASPDNNDDDDNVSSASDSTVHLPAPRLDVQQSLYRRTSSIASPGFESGTFGRIAFSLKKQVDQKHGVPMSLLVKKSEHDVMKVLHAASDEVMAGLVEAGMRKVTLRIAWPAYVDCFERDIDIVCASGSSQSARTISRAALARHIADAFFRFIRSGDPREAMFRFGPGALSFADLWLVSLWHAGGNVFEAEIESSGRIAQGDDGTR